MAEQPQRRGASNNDIFDGQWPQLRGQVRSWWGQLTDADLDTITGKKDVLVGLLQERYGYTHERAEHEVERRVHEYREQGEGLRGRPDRGDGEHCRARCGRTPDGDGRCGEYNDPGDGWHRRQGRRGHGERRGWVSASEGGGPDHGRRDRLDSPLPIPAALIGLGIGLLVGRSLGKATRTAADARGAIGPRDARERRRASFEEIER